MNIDIDIDYGYGYTHSFCLHFIFVVQFNVQRISFEEGLVDTLEEAKQALGRLLDRGRIRNM